MTNSSQNNPISGYEQSRRDPRTTEVLIEAAVAEEAAGSEACPALVALQARGTRDVLDAAVALCSSSERIQRLVGAQILGELGTPRSFPEECCDTLLHLVHNEKDEEVLAVAVFRLGHLGNRRCEPDVIALRHHMNPQIRHGVAFALVGATSPAAVEALLELMEDSEPMARDWATTSIGQTLALDGARIRDALLRRADDDDIFVRAEGLHGLARRGDVRAAPLLIKEIMHPKSETIDPFEDAARCLLGYKENAKASTAEILEALQGFPPKTTKP